MNRSDCPTKLLLRRSDGVLGDLGDAELDDGLGLDLDGFAGLGVAAETSLALCLDELADAGNGELTVLLGFLDGGLGEQLEEARGLFVGEFHLLREVADECGLGHSLCHVCCSFGSCSEFRCVAALAERKSA